MANETRMTAVIDRLVALTAAQTGWRRTRDDTALTGITVFDGPEFYRTDDAADDSMLVIGWSTDPDEGAVVSGSTQLSAGPIAGSARPRDEIGTVTCRAIFRRGGTPKVARDGALAVITVVADICRADPTLGIQTSDTIGGVITRAWVTAGDLIQYLQDDYVAEWDFTVTYRTRV